MDTSGPEPEAAPPAVPFVPNGKKPKGAFKTWKTEKKTESTYRERRAKRVEAAQAAVATKRGLVTDGNRWVDAHTQFTTGEEAFVDDEDANTETTWEEISYDQVREAVARQILAVTHNEIDPAHLETYKSETSSKWDAFYKGHKEKFFKDRNYLGRTFKELAAPENVDETQDRQVLMEVGSGVGNSVFPLLNVHPNKYFYAFDCSANAIDLFRAHENYNEERVRAFVCDITREDIPSAEVKDGSVDFVTMIFMLSAVPPEHHDGVLQKINKKMKMGGLVLFRDYGVYDMTQMRFYAKRKANKLGPNFYRRTDGTFTYFFSLEVLADLFQRNGFEIVENDFDTRVLSNRKRKVRMYRVWAQCRFAKVSEASPTAEESASSSAPQ